MQFPRIIFQHRPEGYASRTCEDSTRDAYFCLSFTADTTRKDALDAVTCASAVQQRQGPHPDSRDETYTRAADRRPPTWTAGRTLLGATSLYPPRRDFVVVRRRLDGERRAWAAPAAARITRTPRCTPNKARAAMPDIDAVTMATPPADAEQTVMFSVPATWPDGDYVAYLEINTEGDYNGIFNSTAYPTPQSSDWDSWAMSYGYPYRGQPSVVFASRSRSGRPATFLDDDAGRLRLRRRHRRGSRARCTRWTDRSPTIRRARRAAAPTACA